MTLVTPKIGEKFDQWEVISEPFHMPVGSKQLRAVKCRCTGCEEVLKDIPINRLTGGHTGACQACAGKKRRKVKVGDTFASWTVIGDAGRDTVNKKVLWKCRCACKNEADVTACNLLSGASTQCTECARSSQRNGAEGTHWHKIVQNAACRNIPLEITWEFVKQLLVKQDFKCALTGWHIQLASDCAGIKAGLTTASLDRISSDGPYSESNVQWTHRMANICKLDYTQEEFVALCHAVAITHPEPVLPADSACACPSCTPQGSGFQALSALSSE